MGPGAGVQTAPRPGSPPVSTKRRARGAAATPPYDGDDERNARAVAMLAKARHAPRQLQRSLQQRVMVEYLDLADAVANRFRGSGVEAPDLHQVAYLGLAKAVRGFDPAHGGEIASFAVPTISGEIKRYLRDVSWAVRPPRRLQELSAEVLETAPALAQRLGRPATLDELAEAVGRPAATVAEALHCAGARRALSLDAPPPGETATAGSLGDLLPADGSALERVEAALALAPALRALTPEEYRVIHLRFFRDMTQVEVAHEIGVSQMQVSRLLQRILARLRSLLSAPAAQQ